MRDIALTLFIFGTIPFILMRPYVGLLVWSWIGYMNPHRLTYGFAFSFPWVMLVAIVTLASLAFSRESKKIPWSAFSVLLVVFLLWTGFTTLFAAVPGSAWEQWQVFAKILVMAFVTLILVNSRERMDWLVWVIVVSLGFYGVKGGLSTIVHGGAYHVLGPLDSFITNNNDLAQALCMTLPLMRYLQLQASEKTQKIGLGLAMLLVGIAVLGTYSRGGFITLAVVSAALLLKGRRRIVIGIVVVVLGFTALHFMPQKWIARMDTLHHAEKVETAQTRIQSWEFAANVALHRPLVGGGFNVYQSTSMWRRYAPEGAKQRAVHSIYFRVLGEQGFIGLGLFLALLLVSWRACAKVRRRARGSPEHKWAFDLASMLQVTLLALMTAGLASTSSYFDLSYQVMALCALLALHVRQSANQRAAEPHHGNSGALLRSPATRSVAPE